MKNLKSRYPTGGRKLEKVKSGKNKGKDKCKTRRFEDRHPAAGPGLSDALGSLCEGGEEEQGGSEGLLEASHAGKGAGKGKKSAVGLRGG